jgi:hypothetical protein
MRCLHKKICFTETIYSSYRRFHRLICLAQISKISAACHHVIGFAIARKIISCTFIVRSISASLQNLIFPSAMKLYHLAPQSGHFIR